MDEGDMYESEVITFVAPKKSGWLKKKSTGESFSSHFAPVTPLLIDQRTVEDPGLCGDLESV